MQSPACHFLLLAADSPLFFKDREKKRGADSSYYLPAWKQQWPKTSALARAPHMHAWTPPAPPSPLQSTNGFKALRWRAKQHFKDYTRDLLMRANIPLIQLESLALDRLAWQVTCATPVSQIHQTNQDRRSARRIKRQQWVAGTPLVSGSPCSICRRVCGSRIRLNAHEKWHQLQHLWTHPPPTPSLDQVSSSNTMELRVCVCVCVCDLRWRSTICDKQCLRFLTFFRKNK